MADRPAIAEFHKVGQAHYRKASNRTAQNKCEQKNCENRRCSHHPEGTQPYLKGPVGRDENGRRSKPRRRKREENQKSRKIPGSEEKILKVFYPFREQKAHKKKKDEVPYQKQKKLDFHEATYNKKLSVFANQTNGVRL